jgi:hypothetical protein
MVRYFGQTTDVRIFNLGSAPPTQLDIFYRKQTAGLKCGLSGSSPNSEIWNRPRRRARPRCIGIP